MAICVYHRRTDADVIPALVAASGAGYRMQCGACSFDGNLRLVPDIMFFN